MNDERYSGSFRRFGLENGLVARFSRHENAIELRRCNGKRTFVRLGAEPVNIELGGGLLSWDSGHVAQIEAEEGVPYHRGTLTVYQLSTGRRQSYKLPQRPLRFSTGGSEFGVFGYSAHTGNRVFWLATETLIEGTLSESGGSAVYIAPIRWSASS